MEFDLNLPAAIALFLGSSAVVIFSAIALARAGDVIAARTGLGHLWVGSLLIAGATSLPELVTNITAVRIDNPGLAAGNILGANMLNVSNLAVIAAVFGGREIYQRLSRGQEYLAIEAFILTALAATYVLMDPDLNWFGVTPAAISILVVYLIGSRVLYVASKAGGGELQEQAPDKSLSWGWIVFIVSAVFVAVSAWALAVSADAIAEETGISASFIGVLAVAIVTTLPELTVGITAIRIGAPEMAVAGLYGSNAFNIAILAVADIAYVEGSLFGALDDSHIVAGGFAVLLMGLGLIQVRLRRTLKYFALTEPSTILIVAIYLAGLFLVFRAG
ncbi:MAG: hypothetical protein OXK21_04260 [Chloroflexota bacterium]|nr:hypothetical protein [Chloroflexota bacterium]